MIAGILAKLAGAKVWLIAGAVAIGIIVTLFFLWQGERESRIRVEGNQTTLLADVAYYKEKDSSSTASIGALELSFKEFKRTQSEEFTDLKDRLEVMDIRLRNIKSVSSANIETVTEFNTYLKDSTIYRTDTTRVKALKLETEFNSVDLIVFPDNRTEGRIITRDKLTQVVYKERRGDTFFKRLRFWKRRPLIQEINFENPDTKITYSRYIELTKKR